MRTSTKAALVVAGLGAAAVALAKRPEHPKHTINPSPTGDLVVALCDGRTQVEVKGKKNGQKLSPAEARGVADELMREWMRKNPTIGRAWDQEQRLAQAGNVPGGNKTDTAAHGAHTPRSPAPVTAPGAAPRAPVAPQASNAAGPGNAPAGPSTQFQEGHTYGAHTTRDEQIWRASTEAFVEQGNRVFHSADAIGGTIGVSCDMCHPNAANTHPETYPKYQVQLGRVALLRDMINWCIENPARGKPLADDDPRMKQLEAYILAQRRGVALHYGKR